MKYSLKTNLCVCVFRSQNPGKHGQEIQISTADLIIGLVQLVPYTNSAEISPEAMEVRPVGRTLF